MGWRICKIIYTCFGDGIFSGAGFDPENGVRREKAERLGVEESNESENTDNGGDQREGEREFRSSRSRLHCFRGRSRSRRRREWWNAHDREEKALLVCGIKEYEKKLNGGKQQ